MESSNKSQPKPLTVDHEPSVYLPMDRRHALAEGRTMPDRLEGAALFADISGFTSLTESLAQILGSRLNAVQLVV